MRRLRLLLERARKRWLEANVVATGLGAVHEVATPQAPERSGVRLARRQAHGSQRRAVHALAGDHVAAGVYDADRERERAGLRLGPHSREQLERSIKRRVPLLDQAFHDVTPT